MTLERTEARIALSGDRNAGRVLPLLLRRRKSFHMNNLQLRPFFQAQDSCQLAVAIVAIAETDCASAPSSVSAGTSLQSAPCPRLRIRSFASLLATLAACASRADAPVVSQVDAPVIPPEPCAGQPAPAADVALLRQSEDRPQPPFSVSLVPTVPLPIRIGTQLGFSLSSATAGYASLYVIDPVRDVQILAENRPLGAGGFCGTSPFTQFGGASEGGRPTGRVWNWSGGCGRRPESAGLSAAGAFGGGLRGMRGAGSLAFRSRPDGTGAAGGVFINDLTPTRTKGGNYGNRSSHPARSARGGVR